MKVKKYFQIMLLLIIGFLLIACEKDGPVDGKEELNAKMTEFFENNDQFKINQSVISTTKLNGVELTEPVVVEGEIYMSNNSSYSMIDCGTYYEVAIFENDQLCNYTIPKTLLGDTDTKAVILSTVSITDITMYTSLLSIDFFTTLQIIKVGNNHFKADLSMDDFMQMIGGIGIDEEDLEGMEFEIFLEFLTGDNFTLIFTMNGVMDMGALGSVELSSILEMEVVPTTFEEISLDSSEYLVFTDDFGLAPQIELNRIYKITTPPDLSLYGVFDVNLEVGDYEITKPFGAEIEIYKDGVLVYESPYDIYSETTITYQSLVEGEYQIVFSCDYSYGEMLTQIGIKKID